MRKVYKGNKFLAVVPARGGSKGIHKKNIVMVNGRELITYTLDAAKGSKYLDEIIVSTDSDEIASVAEREGIKVMARPAELAQDESKIIDVLLDVVHRLSGENYDYLVLLQPTQPLRLPTHIDCAIEEMIDQNHTSLVSVFPAKNHPLLMRRMDTDKKLTRLIDKGSTVRRQDFEKFYVVNGTIYINRIKDMGPDTSLNDNKYGFLMPSEFDLDVDEPEDLERLAQIIKNSSAINELVTDNRKE